MNGRFDATLSFEDYLTVNWFIIRRRWLWKGLILFLAIVTVFYTLLLCGIDLLGGHVVDMAEVLQAALIGCGVAVVMALAIALGWRIVIPMRARKAYRESKLEGVSTSYTFSADGIDIANRFGISTHVWPDLVGWAESDRMFMLYRTSMLFYAFPKSQVAPETVDALRKALAQAGVATRW